MTCHKPGFAPNPPLWRLDNHVTTMRRRCDDDATTMRRRCDDDTTTMRRRCHDNLNVNKSPSWWRYNLTESGHGNDHMGRPTRNSGLSKQQNCQSAKLNVNHLPEYMVLFLVQSLFQQATYQSACNAGIVFTHMTERLSAHHSLTKCLPIACWEWNQTLTLTAACARVMYI